MRLIFAALSFFAVSASGATERETAEWVLRWEGSVVLGGANATVREVSKLPPGDIHITAIDLTGAVMHPVELRRLTGLPELRELYLPGPIWNPGTGKEDKSGVFQSLATLTSVERLSFGWHFNAEIEVNDEDIRQLAPWSQLQQLRCSQCSLEKADLSAFRQMRDLDLSYNPFTDAGMAGLAALTKLRRLLLRDTLSTDEGLKYLKDLTALEELDLSGTRVTDQGIQYLRGLKSMRRLNLLGAQASDESMSVLSSMPSLEVLNLYRTHVTNSGLATLAAMRKLTDVDVRYSRVTPNGVDSLRAALPELKIRFDGASLPKTESAGALRPRDSSDQAIASWVKQMGGTV